MISLLAGVTQIYCIGCTPAWLKYDQMAEDFKFDRAVITTAHFNIVVYKNRISDLSKRLHVYLDGDGSPWKRGGSLVNEDPTPRQYLVLHLMSLDSTPAVLIGRPCYHGFNQDVYCDPLLWTHARYSEQVVSVMSDALEILLEGNDVSEVVLIGYSGGGTLAQLLAERIPQTRMVVTLAGNLDLVAWTRLHGYSPLVDSINPAKRPPLAAHIPQIHYVGRFDNNILPSLTESYVSQKNRGKMIILEHTDHANGWIEQWPTLLIDLHEKLESNNKRSSIATHINTSRAND
ncbi:MAG: alpha/beta hydrolase [Candidatus Competibacteraceae bacterium]|nr:alpha/beta hydrolase [Candidatus Competibacteraceae bacterium]